MLHCKSWICSSFYPTATYNRSNISNGGNITVFATSIDKWKKMVVLLASVLGKLAKHNNGADCGIGSILDCAIGLGINTYVQHHEAYYAP